MPFKLCINKKVYSFSAISDKVLISALLPLITEPFILALIFGNITTDEP